jgi:hypothetical protein
MNYKVKRNKNILFELKLEDHLQNLKYLIIDSVQVLWRKDEKNLNRGEIDIEIEYLKSIKV